jgi:dihydropteroate synthase
MKKNKIKIMGILNVTPDSFSDGGKFYKKKDALDHVAKMIDEGADIIDIGGESSRPYATPVSLADEKNRVLPILAEIKKKYDIPISIDTYKKQMIKAAIDAGADMINDITALSDEFSVDILKKAKIPVCIMHMQGTPDNMQKNPYYKNVVFDVYEFFFLKIKQLIELGIEEKNIIIDPGFGFGKTPAHNVELLNGLAKFKNLKKTILVGLSRKSLIPALSDYDDKKRIGGSIALILYAIQQGANIVRVHDVLATRQAIDVYQKINL